MTLFSRWAEWYDDLYQASGRDPAAEVRAIQSTLDASTTIGQQVRHRLHHRQLRTLDIGCGTGRHAEACGALGEYAGIDPCPEMLEVARRRHPRTLFLTGTAAAAPQLFPTGHRFDVVVMLFGVAAYAASMREAGEWLGAASSLLAPGGALFVGVEVTRETLLPAQPRSIVVHRDDAVLTRESRGQSRRDHLECTFQFRLQAGSTKEHTDGERWTECHSHLLASRREWRAAISDALSGKPERPSEREEPAEPSSHTRTGFLSVQLGPWEEIVLATTSHIRTPCLRSPEPCAPSQTVAPS